MTKKFLGIDQSMIVARYLEFHVVFRDYAELPVWKGNLLRGAIGSVLPKICGLKKFNCLKCSLWENCPFGYLYRARSKGIVLRRLKGMSKPFVLKPPLNRETVFEPGEELVFSIVLFGDATRFEKDLITSIIKLGRRGIGRRDLRGRFNVVEIVSRNPFRGVDSLLFREGEVYGSGTYISFSDIVSRAETIAGSDGFVLSFLTPYRIISRNQTLSILDFKTIVKYVSRRFTNIFAQYMYVIPDYDIHRVLEEADKVELEEVEVREVKIKYRGVPEEYYIGEYRFNGSINRVTAAILAFGELAHVGKRSTYGHGWYKITTINP